MNKGIIVEIECFENSNGLSTRIYPIIKSDRYPNLELDSENLLKQLTAFSEGLSACILKIEDSGLLKKGEAMKKAINRLEENYIDIKNKVFDFKISKKQY